MYQCQMSSQHDVPCHSILLIAVLHTQLLHIYYQPVHSFYALPTPVFCAESNELTTAFHMQQVLPLHPSDAFVLEPLTNECT